MRWNTGWYDAARLLGGVATCQRLVETFGLYNADGTRRLVLSDYIVLWSPTGLHRMPDVHFVNERVTGVRPSS